MLRGERQIDVDEARDIEAAHFKFCAEKAAANNDENRKLFETMQQALAAMQQSDAEFFAGHIEAVRDLFFHHGNMGRKEGDG